MKSRKYGSREEAFEQLRAIGNLEFFGRAGLQYEYCVTKLTLPDGREFKLDIYDDGKVILRE